MTVRPNILTWDQIQQDMAVTVPFSVSRDDMEKFAELSGDRSRIHMDRAFARARGFEDVVVYGALTVARLSNLVGMYLPGDFGLATSWKIDFNRPLYVDEEAVMEATITHKSEATHTVKLKFQVRCGDKLVASGTAGSKLLDGPD